MYGFCMILLYPAKQLQPEDIMKEKPIKVQKETVHLVKWSEAKMLWIVQVNVLTVNR